MNHAVRIDGEWLVPNRWHIDDVKDAIEGSQYENRPMPSDEALMEYLFHVVGTETWIELMNEQLAMNLFELFEPGKYNVIDEDGNVCNHKAITCPQRKS
jgi:hypothetical protein